MSTEKNVPEIRATLEILPIDDIEPVRGVVEMTDAERQAAEQEKAAILRSLPEKPRHPSSLPDSPKANRHPRATSPLPSVLPERPAIGRLTDLLDATAKEAAQAQQKYEDTRQADRNAELRSKLAPHIEAAKAALVEIRSFDREYRRDLQRLANASWKDSPASWPVQLRADFESQVVYRAAKLLRSLDGFLNLEQFIAEAERILSTGWQRHPEFPREVNEVIGHLRGSLISNVSQPSDRVFSLHRSYDELHGILTDLCAKGEHAAGQQPEVRVVPRGGAAPTPVASNVAHAVSNPDPFSV